MNEPAPAISNVSGPRLRGRICAVCLLGIGYAVVLLGLFGVIVGRDRNGIGPAFGFLLEVVWFTAVFATAYRAVGLPWLIARSERGRAAAVLMSLGVVVIAIVAVFIAALPFAFLAAVLGSAR